MPGETMNDGPIMASRNQPEPPPRHGFQYPSIPRVSAATCDSPPADARTRGLTTTKPTSSTASCTALTRTEVSSPPAVK